MKVTHNDISHWIKNPPDRQTDQRDDSGLIVRRNIDGSITFCCRKRIGSRRVRKTFGRFPDLSLAEARKEARAWLSGMVPEAEIGQRSRRRTTWGDVVDAYLVACRAKNKSWKQQEHSLLTYPPKAWWAMPAEDLSKARVQDVLMGMKGKYQANRLLAYMKAALNHAVRLELIQVNPIRDMKRPFKEKSRKNVLDFQQLHQLWTVCDGHEYPAAKAIQLLVLTGARRGEILSARWDDITDDRWLSVIANKADRPHKIYLADLTWGWWLGDDFVRGDPYHNVAESLGNLPVALIYVAANVALAFHIFHGTWSLFQSLGVNNPKYNNLRRNLATGVAAIVLIGNLSFPIMTQAGLIDEDNRECPVNDTEGLECLQHQAEDH